MHRRHRCRHRNEVAIVIAISVIAILSLVLNMCLLAGRGLTVHPSLNQPELEPVRVEVNQEEA